MAHGDLRAIEHRVKQTLDNWESARNEETRIRRLYIASGKFIPGRPLRWPERILDQQGIKQIEQAEQETAKAWDEHVEAIEVWRKASGH